MFKVLKKEGKARRGEFSCAAAAPGHPAGGLNAQGRGGVAQPQEIGGDIGGNGGQGLRVTAGLGQEAAQQGTEKGRELLGDAAGIENFHNAAPKTEDTRHGEAQFLGGLGTVQGGRGHRVQISGAETA